MTKMILNELAPRIIDQGGTGQLIDWQLIELEFFSSDSMLSLKPGQAEILMR
jgi:hypothetical protein